MQRAEKELFKCPVCGFLSESFPEVTRHIKEQHPDRKVSSIPSVPAPREHVVARKQPRSTGPVKETTHKLLTRIVKEILPQLADNDLDEIAALIKREKTRRKKEASETARHILTP